MLSSVEAWWEGLCALPFDRAQGDSPIFWITICLLYLSCGLNTSRIVISY